MMITTKFFQIEFFGESEITTISETGKFFGGEVASLTNIERV
ncbi:MAG: hypothetical protein PHG66_01145 [Candidatus Colwellbacteria bacterium]|nr:hypothetical protein [Candidatus Colwellbacteria bacterium]